MSELDLVRRQRIKSGPLVWHEKIKLGPADKAVWLSRPALHHIAPAVIFHHQPDPSPPPASTQHTVQLTDREQSSRAVHATSAILIATMGRRPNALILQYFERGPKLQDQSNRYPHTCKA